jgi:hypothetical protein
MLDARNAIWLARAFDLMFFYEEKHGHMMVLNSDVSTDRTIHSFNGMMLVGALVLFIACHTTLRVHGG